MKSTAPRIAVRCIDTGEEFSSMVACANHFRLDLTTLRKSIVLGDGECEQLRFEVINNHDVSPFPSQERR